MSHVARNHSVAIGTLITLPLRINNLKLSEQYLPMSTYFGRWLVLFRKRRVYHPKRTSVPRRIENENSESGRMWLQIGWANWPLTLS